MKEEEEGEGGGGGGNVSWGFGGGSPLMRNGFREAGLRERLRRRRKRIPRRGRPYQCHSQKAAQQRCKVTRQFNLFI